MFPLLVSILALPRSFLLLASGADSGGRHVLLQGLMGAGEVHGGPSLFRWPLDFSP